MKTSLIVQWILIPIIHGFSDYEEIPLFDWYNIKEDLATVVSRCPVSMDWTCNPGSSLKNCHCDQECVKYGDCCLDKAEETVHDRSSTFQDPWQCQPLITEGLTNVYMITSCPDSFEDKSIKNKCILDPEEEHTYHLDLPVSSILDGRIFQNIFCAICNGIKLQNLTENSAIITCNNMDIIDSCDVDIREDILIPENYLQGTLSWTKHFGQQRNNCSDQDYFLTCRLIVDEVITQNFGGKSSQANDVIDSRKTCLPQPKTVGRITDSCPDEIRFESGSSRRDHEKLPEPARKKREIGKQSRLYCSLYSYFVIAPGSGGTIFKNPHCAACHGIQMNETICHHDVQRIWPFKADPFASISLTLKFTNASDYDGYDDYYNEDFDEICDQDQFYDPVYANCYNVRCGFLYKNVAGRCVYRNITESLKGCNLIFGNIIITFLSFSHLNSEQPLRTYLDLEWSGAKRSDLLVCSNEKFCNFFPHFYLFSKIMKP